MPCTYPQLAMTPRSMAVPHGRRGRGRQLKAGLVVLGREAAVPEHARAPPPAHQQEHAQGEQPQDGRHQHNDADYHARAVPRALRVPPRVPRPWRSIPWVTP